MTALSGLSRLEAGNRNLLVAFATQPGNVAYDGGGTNSPFSLSLIDNLLNRAEIREVLTLVRADVAKKTSNEQIPWEQNSLLETIFLAGKDDGLSGRWNTSDFAKLIDEIRQDISEKRYGVAYRKIGIARTIATSEKDRTAIKDLESKITLLLR